MKTNHIITGDSAEVLKGFDADCIDLTVTSPPYDNLRTYKGFTFDFEAIARELYRVTKPGGVVVWVVGDATVNGSETGTSFTQALFFKSLGFNLHDTMIYEKINFIPLTHNRYEQSFEYMFIFSKGKPATFTPKREANKTAGNVYNLARKGYCATVKEGAQRRRQQIVEVKENKIHRNIFQYSTGGGRVGHPAPFPMELARDHILTWSKPGDIVLDCFAGSGTTCKMAKENGRQYIGIEISSEYVGLAEKRILATSPALFA